MIFKILLALIIILSIILRVWSLDKYPGFNADEAAIGYNAYSLLQTGKDEYGASWPLAFKSFGDFKPGLYFYIVMPFVAALGLNEWAVRLPSALLGTLTVFLVFFLTKEIFKDKRVAILASLLLAISPWHIHFSRGGWETNAATTFITLGILLFIKGLENKKLLFGSMLAMLSSMYMYQSPRLVVPILYLLLFFLYRKKLLPYIKQKSTYGFLLILVILSIPLILQFTSGQGGARFTGLSFLSDPGPSSRVNQLRGEYQDPNSLPAKLFHNKLTAYGFSFMGHYLDHFTADFLFINGDPLIRNKVPETGEFYIIEALFLIIGLIFLTKSKFEHTKLLLSWILVAPIASTMTYQTPHALRALNMVIPLTLIMAFGLWKIISSFRAKAKIAVVVFITIFISFEFVHYMESYYVHLPKRYPLASEYGFKEMVNKLNLYKGSYKNIVITDRYDQPYILVLFFDKYDPKKYQPQAVLTERDKFNFGTVRSFDNFQFRPIDPKEVSTTPETLFIGTDQEIPKDANILDKVLFPNGEPAFIFVGKH